jgi:antitoxin component YwqK of YwqJK toxin-antitoxin module
MKKNSIIIIILFLSFKLNLVAQVYYISPSDTNRVIYILERAVKNEYNYRELPPFDFKNINLKNGTWIISKSDKRNINNIYAKGNFNTGLRTGKFDFLFYKGKPQIIYNFKKGKLDGVYQAYLLNKLVDEGYYNEGNRNGYFIQHDQWTGTILSVEKFENDSLKEWTKYYPSIGVPYQKGWGERENLHGECFEYDTIGQINQSGIYENGVLKEFKEFYSNSTRLKSNSIGVFKKCKYDYAHLFYCDIKLLVGTKTYFAENGEILKVEKFLNGIIEP